MNDYVSRVGEQDADSETNWRSIEADLHLVAWSDKQTVTANNFEI